VWPPNFHRAAPILNQPAPRPPRLTEHHRPSLWTILSGLFSCRPSSSGATLWQLDDDGSLLRLQHIQREPAEDTASPDLVAALPNVTPRAEPRPDLRLLNLLVAQSSSEHFFADPDAIYLASDQRTGAVSCCYLSERRPIAARPEPPDRQHLTPMPVN